MKNPPQCLRGRAAASLSHITPPPLLAALVLMASSASFVAAKDIVWIAQTASPAGQEFKTLLGEKGYTVTEIAVASATLTPAIIDQMNAADLVIFSRKAVSGNYNTADWDNITAPMIVMTPFMTRSSHWGWFTGTGLADATPAQMFIEDPQHPLFAGVAVVDNATGPWHIAVDLGTSFATDAVDNGGTLLASTPAGAVAAAEWPADTVASGPRMLLCMGSRELSGADIATAGKYNLTELGANILLNAVRHYAPLDPADTDGDGVPNVIDAFPNDPTEWEDTDGDGIGNNADPDDDNDGRPDAQDAFPKDPAEWEDTDGDGIGNNSDPDLDNDWVPNADDKFPQNPNEWDDTDNDGIGDNADPDANGDGIPDPPVSRIVWASQYNNEHGQEFIDLLTAAGHVVQRFVGGSTALALDPASVARVFHTADVVIFSRQYASTEVNTPVWDQIKTPMIVFTPYVSRSTIWGWLTGTGVPDEFPFAINVLEPEHALFEGVPVDAFGSTEAWHVDVNRGTTFAAAEEVAAGTVLATTEAGSLAAVQWPTGAVAAGPRLLLCMGAREANGATVETAGAYNLTEIGEKILLNAVGIYSQPAAPPAGGSFEIADITYQANPRQVTLRWPSAAGEVFRIERTTTLAANEWAVIQSSVPAAAGSSTQFADAAPPENAPAIYYRVRRQ